MKLNGELGETVIPKRRHSTWNKKWAVLPVAILAYVCTTSSPGFTSSFGSLCNKQSPVVQPARVTERFSSNGRTDLVQWDGKSMVVKGQRIFLWSGEFHTFRLPAPELWGDILEKTKAAGFNAISVYVHWGLVNPAPGELDFTGFRALEPLFKLAMQSGLWVVLRPGPYINAEVSAGGIPHWVTATTPGHLRTNNTAYTEAWVPYIDAIADMLVKGNWQVGDKTGGPVIAVQLENEYLATSSPGHAYKAPYMSALAKRFVDRGVVVPLTYNDAYMGGNYATGDRDTCEEGQEEGGDAGGTGKGRCGVEIYGVDSYPQRFDCSNPDVWNPVVTTYDDFHRKTNPGEPLYIPEFQGGAFDAWGGGAKHGWAGAGYEACRQLTGPDFSQVFNLGLWSNNAKMINLYMLYGGTTWGYLPFPGVYTSYDYGAAITETRRLTDKYAELKREGFFLRSVPEFYAADIVGNSADSDAHPTVQVSDPKVFATLLRNEATGAEFYIVRHLNSTSNDDLNFRLTLPPSSDSRSTPDSIPLTLPAISLTGRASKVLLRNVAFGSSRLAWSTASILYAGKMGSRDVVFLYGPSNEGHEFAVPLKGRGGVSNLSEHVLISENPFLGREGERLSIVTILPGSVGLVTILESDSQLVLFADSETAGGFWAPTLAPHEDSLGKSDPYANFFQFGTNASVLVGGPYLVRGAELSSSGELSLRGDLEKESMLFVIAELGAVRRVFWNGIPVDTMLQGEPGTEAGVLQFNIAPRLRAADIKVPELVGWRYHDSLPEVQEGYDDSKWITADNTTTNSPAKPYFGGKVLYGCDYGFCEGAVIWRGHFDGNQDASGARLVINGGNAFAASVWLNGAFLKTTYGNSSNNHNNVHETDEFYKFPSDLLNSGGNVLTVVQDNMGLEMTVDWTADASKSPRGIRGYELSGGSFTKWKVQGKAGGYRDFKDKLRGVQNEGGLYGEREGWHLPDFDDSGWSKLDLSAGLPENQAGVGWFRTSFSLEIPGGYDVPLSFEFEDESSPYRALLFVNGWLMGRRIANLGPQYKFPVPEGILNHRGENTAAVAIWSMEDASLSPKLKLTVEGIFDSGYYFESPL